MVIVFLILYAGNTKKGKYIIFMNIALLFHKSSIFAEPKGTRKVI